ncbi:OmpA family protein [Actinotalea sp. K2]|nr:OmpA family protein [Actinotalea sp. K2]
MESYTEQVGGQVRTRETVDEVTVEIASDVLFAVDEDVLSPQADAALDAAGRQIAAYPAGALRVVGHTDDVASEAYNQALSERRAAAVAARLGELVDLGAYEVSVEGRGESEPAVAGTGEAQRAVNRRVELRFTPAGDRAADDAQVELGVLPESTGPTVSGLAEVTVEQVFGSQTRTFRLAVASMRRIDGYLVGELTLTNAGADDAPLVTVLAAGAWDARGTFDASLQAAANRVTLISGDTRVYPLDYVVREGQRDPVADRILTGLGPEETMTVTVVWPDVPGQTVTLDAPQLRKQVTDSVGVDVGGPPFRITDVPVTR